MEESRVVMSIGNYEGGLLGLSFKEIEQITEGQLKTEFAFSAT